MIPLPRNMKDTIPKKGKTRIAVPDFSFFLSVCFGLCWQDNEKTGNTSQVKSENFSFIAHRFMI